MEKMCIMNMGSLKKRPFYSYYTVQQYRVTTLNKYILVTRVSLLGFMSFILLDKPP